MTLSIQQALINIFGTHGDTTGMLEDTTGIPQGYYKGTRDTTGILQGYHVRSNSPKIAPTHITKGISII